MDVATDHRRVLGLKVGLTVGVLLLAALALGGCGGHSTVIPSALDLHAIDASAEPGPAALPNLAMGVPADSILEKTTWTAFEDGTSLFSRGWQDFSNERYRSDSFGDPAGIGGGPTTTSDDPETATIDMSEVWQTGEVVHFDAYSGELMRWEAPVGSDIEQWFGGGDVPNDDVILLGQQQLGATIVDVYRADIKPLEDAEPSSGPPLTHVLVYVDATTKLRLREEWMVGSPGDGWVEMYEYRLLPSTPDLEARVSSQALFDLAVATLAAKKEELKKLDFPVWGLPDGTDGLILSGIVLTRDDKVFSVGLTYSSQGAIGAPPALWIKIGDIRDPSHSVDPPPGPRGQAQAHEGEDAYITFRMNEPATAGQPGYDTVVYIQTNDGIGRAAALDVKALAEALIDLRQPVGQASPPGSG